MKRKYGWRTVTNFVWPRGEREREEEREKELTEFSGVSYLWSDNRTTACEIFDRVPLPGDFCQCQKKQ